LFLFDVV